MQLHKFLKLYWERTKKARRRVLLIAIEYNQEWVPSVRVGGRNKKKHVSAR
jgi:hypothetical protein